MALINPYNPIEHKVYNRTFMRSASATIEYADISFMSHFDGLARYFKDNFNAVFNPAKDDELESIEINSNAEQLSYLFLKSISSVLVGAKDYKSFSASMQPRIGKLVAFLDAVGRSSVKSITLKKENVWDLKSEDVMSAYKTAIFFTFQDENIREVAKLNVPGETKPIKMSREANVSLGDGRLTVRFIVEIPDDGHIRFLLNLEAIATDVKTADILQAASVLNEVIYCAFHDLVTPDIINLMEKRNGH